MKIAVQEMPIRLGTQINETAYVIICDGQIRDCYKSMEEANRIANLLHEDSKNPEDY